jgi:hypothetical protein
MSILDDPKIAEGLRKDFTNQTKKLFLRQIFKSQGISRRAVPIDMEPPAAVLEALQELKKAGHENPIAFGGALRDAYLQQKEIAAPLSEGDIDIALKPTGGNEYFAEQYKIPDMKHFLANAGFASHTVELLNNNVSGISNATLSTSDTYKEFDACIEADFQSKTSDSTFKVDLCFSDRNYDLEGLATTGDAPINSIAMDADGNIFAHSQFEAHAKTLTYESIDNANQFGNRAEERFQRLKERLPSLIKAGEKASVFSETRATLRKLTGYNL